MYTTINLKIISTVCPKDMNRGNCPVRQYLDKSDLFNTTLNETLIEPAKPFSLARDEFIAAIDKMHMLCKKCKCNQK